MELFRLIADLIIAPMVLWCIYLTLANFQNKERLAVLSKEYDFLADRLKYHSTKSENLEAEVRAELKAVHQKIDDMPSKIVELLKTIK